MHDCLAETILGPPILGCSFYLSSFLKCGTQTISLIWELDRGAESLGPPLNS